MAEHRAPRRALQQLLQDKEKEADGFREIGGSKRRGVEETVGGEEIGRAAIVLDLQVNLGALPAGCTTADRSLSLAACDGGQDSLPFPLLF